MIRFEKEKRGRHLGKMFPDAGPFLSAFQNAVETELYKKSTARLSRGG